MGIPPRTIRRVGAVHVEMKTAIVEHAPVQALLASAMAQDQILHAIHFPPQIKKPTISKAVVLISFQWVLGMSIAAILPTGLVALTWFSRLVALILTFPVYFV